MEIIFITKNKQKLAVLRKALRPFNIKVLQKKIIIPEIQDLDVVKVADFSARYAAEILKKPVVVTDVGLYIKSLNGFPGSMLKFFNVWFKPNDVIKLMKGKKDRTALAKDCLVYCVPGKEPIFFISQTKCKIAQKPQGKGTTMNQLLLWPGMNKTQGLISNEAMIDYWSERIKAYTHFGKYLKRIFL